MAEIYPNRSLESVIIINTSIISVIRPHTHLRGIILIGSNEIINSKIASSLCVVGLQVLLNPQPDARKLSEVN